MRIVDVLILCFASCFASGTFACELGQISTADKAVLVTVRQASAACSQDTSGKPVVFFTGEPVALDVKISAIDARSGKNTAELKSVSISRNGGEPGSTKPNVRALTPGNYFVDNIEFNAPATWTIKLTLQRGKKVDALALTVPVQLNKQQAEQTSVAVKAPEFTLINLDEKTVSLADLKGKVWVVGFFFATCPAICPLMTQKMAALQKQFKNSPDFRLVSITTDPVNDTPKALAAFSKKYKADTNRWYFLNGPKKDTFPMSKALRLDISDTSVAHSTRFALVDRTGMVKGVYDSTKVEELEQLRIELKNLL